LTSGAHSAFGRSALLLSIHQIDSSLILGLSEGAQPILHVSDELMATGLLPAKLLPVAIPLFHCSLSFADRGEGLSKSALGCLNPVVPLIPV
jgi:hypothetical protein